MRKTKPVTLSIPQACHESWQDMTPNERGRFCQHCQKTVIDFSIMSDNEIANLVNHSKEQICGRLHVSQLNREIYTTEKNTPWMKIAAVVSALTLATPALSAKNTVIETVQLNEQENIIASGDTTGVISGQVVGNTDNREPLSGATIILRSGKIWTTTDPNGNFSLRLPPDITEKDSLLTICFIGYETMSMKVSSDAPQQNIVIALAPQAYEGVISGGIHAYRRPLVWQRFKQKINRLFH